MLKQKKTRWKISLYHPKENQSFFENDRGKEFFKNVFQKFLKNNSIKHCSGNTTLGAVFKERFNHTIRDLFMKRVKAIGLMFYPRQRKKLLIEYILLLN